MRKKIETVDRPALRLHIDYDYLTVGELGNMLVRVQAALRAVAGLSPGEYDGRYYQERPKFVTSYISTERSIDIYVLLGVAAIVLAAPGGIKEWSQIASLVFHRFKVFALAMGHGEIGRVDDSFEQQTESPSRASEESLTVAVTRGRIDIEIDRPFLDELTPKQRRRLADAVWSLIGPAERVTIGDDESEISLEK